MGSRKLGDINLSDEYLSIGLEDSLTEAIHRFLSFQSGVLIVLNDHNEAKGVITQTMILQAILDNKDLQNTHCKKIMQSDILEFSLETKLSVVMDAVEKRKPKAIVGINGDGEFIGWFSPIDYQTALGYE